MLERAGIRLPVNGAYLAPLAMNSFQKLLISSASIAAPVHDPIGYL